MSGDANEATEADEATEACQTAHLRKTHGALCRRCLENMRIIAAVHAGCLP